MKLHPKTAPHARPHPDDWKQSLRHRSGRVTRSRQVILEILRRKLCPLTPQEIAQALARKRCDLATIYRTLARFEEMGIVQRVDLGDGRARFEIAENQPGGRHHHHLVCRGCSLIVEIDDCIPADLEAQIARQHGFQEINHKLEFFGLCPQCKVRS